MKDNYSSFANFLIDNGISFLQNSPLSHHCSFKIGGNSDFLIIPQNINMLILAYKKAIDLNLKTFILGAGCNILFRDEGFKGVVFKLFNGLDDIQISSNKITVQSGVSIAKLARLAMENSLGGFEGISGIPGSVGGAVFMNAGSYGSEISDFLISVDYIDENGDIKTFLKSQIDFSYRYSIFKDNPNFIIISATFELENQDKESIYTKTQDFLHKRTQKQPLNFPSAGSTFKRPIGGYASALIENAGLKGKSVGGAMVSPKHSGFIVNTGNCTCQNVLDLITIVQEKVYNDFGINLECEVRVI